MKDYAQSFSRLVSVLVLTFTAICTAQSTSLSGPFGFLLNTSSNDPTDSSGTAILGMMNFDGAGNVSGTYTLQNGASGGQAAQTGAGKFTGTYTTTAGGPGSVTISLDIGVALTFAMVVTDGGQGLQLVGTNCSGCGRLGGGSITLQGMSSSTGLAQSFSGALDISILLNGATGTVPLSVSTAANGAIVYTATGGTGSGPIQCDDGSTGTWTSSAPNLTLVVVTNAPSGVISIAGDFLLILPINACGGTQAQWLSGSITGNFGAGGATNLVLHGSGGLLTGIARAASAGSLNGSYGFVLNSAPQPAATVGVMTFDGAGNVTVQKTTVGPPGTGINLPVTPASLASTYSLNPDGSGTITLSSNATLAFVTTDGGSGLLLLQTNGTGNGAIGSNVSWGTARMQ